MSDRTYWIRGLPPPDDPVGVVITIVGAVVGLVVLWLFLNVLHRLALFALAPMIRWLNKPM